MFNVTSLYCTFCLLYWYISVTSVKDFISVVVLEESPCPRGSSRTNFQVLVLVLEAQVLVLVLEPQVLVLVLVLGSSSPRKSSRTVYTTRLA